MSEERALPLLTNRNTPRWQVLLRSLDPRRYVGSRSGTIDVCRGVTRVCAHSALNPFLAHHKFGSKQHENEEYRLLLRTSSRLPEGIEQPRLQTLRRALSKRDD